MAGLAVLTGFTLWLGARALAYPYQLLYGEGLLLEFSRRLAAGEPVYKPLAEFPLGTCNYAPLPLLLARLTFPLLGFGFAAGRVWALLATLAVAGILFSWVWRAGGRVLPAAAVSLAWLGAPYVYHWMPQFRVDLPGLAFSLGGLYVLWRHLTTQDPRLPEGTGVNSGRPAPLLVAALLFVLGLYCKQSFVAAPAAACIYLFTRNRRAGLFLAASTLLLGGIPFAVLMATTRGAVWESLVSSNVNPFDLGLLLSQLGDLARTYLPLLVLAALYLARRPWRAESAGADRADGLMATYVVLAVGTSALAGKVGSWENYFLEPLAALCLGAGLALARLLDRGRLRWAAPLLVMLQAVLMWHTPAQAARLMRADAAANAALRPEVAAAPGPVLSEDAGLLVLAGQPVPYYDFQLTQLALAGRWNQAWEVENLRRGTFPMVIFEYDTRLDVEKYGRYTRAFMSALDYGYRLADRVGKYRVYRPAPLDRDRTVRFRGGPALVGYTLPPPEVHPGETLSLDVAWQATQPMSLTYTSFLHLIDAAGQGVAGDDRQPWDGLYPTPRWAEGEIVRVGYTLTLPADLPPGLYTLRAGWYDPALNRLPTELGTDGVPLAVANVTAPGSQPATVPTAPLDARFAEGIHLKSYRLEKTPGALQVHLRWQTEAFVHTDYTVFVHLQTQAGDPVAQGDGPPVDGLWPSSLWVPGVDVEDAHTVPLPEGLSPGTYRLVIGLYEPVAGNRLPLLEGNDSLSLPDFTLP